MSNDYVQSTDLPGLMAGLAVGTDGGLTSTEADSLIQVIEGDVNGILFSLGIDAPVSSTASPKSFKVVRAIVIQGVMGMLNSMLHSLDDHNEGSREQAFWRRYERAIKNLTDTGGAALADALTFTNQSSERNGSPTTSLQADNPDRYAGQRTLTQLRQMQNENAFFRLYRPVGIRRFFDGGTL
jgi:hypothetical protein